MCMWIIILLSVDLCSGKVTKYIFDPEKIPKKLLNPVHIKAFKNTYKDEISRRSVEHKTLGEMIQSHGFKEEVHEVTTQDGYILGLYQIRGSGPPVLLGHGLGDSGDGWVLAGNRSLGILLAREGYDVWIYNSRGTRYSRGHVNLTTDDNRYWRYEWDEIGRYDLPAVVHHVTRSSTRPYLHYVGFQQGFTIAVVMCGMPGGAGCGALRTLVGVAPLVYLGHVGGPLRDLVDGFKPTLELVAESSTAATIPWRWGHDPESAFQFVGEDRSHIPRALWPLILRHLPETASSRQELHYAQLILSGQFTRYDYGPSNVHRYGSERPPPYDLSNLPPAVCLYYSRGDRVAEAQDVERLKGSLPPLYDELVLDDYNHLDLMFAPGLIDNIYDRILKVLFAREHDTQPLHNLTLADSLQYLLTSTTATTTTHTTPAPQYHLTSAPAPTDVSIATTTARKKKFKIPQNLDMHGMIALLRNVKVPPKKSITETSNINKDLSKVFNNISAEENETLKTQYHWTTALAPTDVSIATTTARKKRFKIPYNLDMHQMIALLRNVKVPPKRNITETSNINKDWSEVFNNISAEQNETLKPLAEVSRDHKKMQDNKRSEHAKAREAFFAMRRTSTEEPDSREKKRRPRMNKIMRKPEMYMPIITGRFLEQRQAKQAEADAHITYFIHKKRESSDLIRNSNSKETKHKSINLRRLGMRHRRTRINLTFTSRYLSNIQSTHD